MDKFTDRVAVITGGASGIGLASAREFYRAGMKLVLADTDTTALEQAVRDLHAAGAQVIGVPTDVSSLDGVKHLAKSACEHFGKVHLLFNNAGVAVYGPAGELTHADWEWSLNVNLWGTIHGVEAFLPDMLAHGEAAHVINTSSFAGLVTSRNMAAYNVAKAGVVALSESLFKDLRGTQVGVSVLCPMRVATNVWATSPQNRPGILGGTQAFRKRPPDETATMSGAVLDADTVARMVLSGIRRNDLYILPHPEGQQMVRRRFAYLDAAFGNASAS